MKKMLYIAPVIIDFDRQNGVAKKVLSHYKIFKVSYDVEMISYGPDCLYHFYRDKIDKIDLNGLNRRIRLYKFINQSLIKKIDFVYIRYHLCDYLFLIVLKNLNKLTSKIVIEIPTYPYEKELLKSHNGILRWFIDFTSRLFLKFYVGRIVTYSNDDTIFGIETIKTLNGIIYDDIAIKKRKAFNEKHINLISVSVTVPCHGYDRLIMGLNHYYKNGGKIDIIYHLVGDGEETQNYKELVKKLKLENNVKLYGFKGGSELDEIYNNADIAIDSLGIHRIGLKTESTLKTREYAAKGLPIVSCNEIDVFNEVENSNYVHKIIADESPVDIEKLIQFYEQIYSKGSDIDISTEIRLASQNKCDMKVTLEKVNQYFSSNL